MNFEIPLPPLKRPLRRRPRQDCMDCGIDTLSMGNGHYYMVRDDVWRSVVPDQYGSLCLNCLEARLGRPLVVGDFMMTLGEVRERMFTGESKSRTG